MQNKWYISTIDERANKLARKYGLGIEIAEYCAAYNMDEYFEDTDAAVKQLVSGIKMRTFHAPFSELFPCAIDPKARLLTKERYIQAIQLAQRYGANKVVIHGGYNPKIYYPIWYTQKSIAFWMEFINEIPVDMTICLENVFEEEPTMLTEIVRQVDNPRIRMCLDVGHVNAYSKIPVMEWLEQCADITEHFHIHNNDTSRDAHGQLMDGTIPMKELLAAIEDKCPNATLTLELMNAEPSVRWLLEAQL